MEDFEDPELPGAERAGTEPAGDEPQPDDDVLPVDARRVAAWLRRTGQRYHVGPDGQLGGLWNGYPFTITVSRGEVLQVRAMWNRRFALERRGEVMELANARHTRLMWPKCFVVVNDDGTMRFVAEVSTPVGAGLSDRQLARVFRLGIGSALAAFAELDARYPDPVLRPPEAS